MKAGTIPTAAAFAAAALPVVSAEEVLGLYVFHRHGDRTAKAWPPVNMTALGAEQAHSSGQAYRSRYVDTDAPRRIAGLSPDVAVLSQLGVSSAVDDVLQGSALAFMQALYPPVGDDDEVETLADGTEVEYPLDGYQYVPVGAVEDAATAEKAESEAWLQGGSGCTKAEVSSNNYLSSPEYMATRDETRDFYQRLWPVVNGTFSEDDASFENAYGIFDLINVATIHNSSITSSDLLTNATLDRLYSLASEQQWNLAYNSSESVRGIAGAILAGQVVDALDLIVADTATSTRSASAPARFNVQFGAYGTFMSFFGLAQLPAASPDFYGICDYASSMAFELVTNATTTDDDGHNVGVAAEDISVRFYFANGTSADNELIEFPLFGQQKTLLSWTDFEKEMMEFGVRDTEHWCDMCGNSGGSCASSSSDDDSNDSDDASSQSCGSDGGISKAVAGVIGALVTLVVVLGVEAAVMGLGGLRLVKRSTLAQATAGAAGAGAVKA